MPPQTINGWQILIHPEFDKQVKALHKEVLDLKKKHPSSYQQKASFKLLSAINKIAYTIIPSDPEQTTWLKFTQIKPFLGLTRDTLGRQRILPKVS